MNRDSALGLLLIALLFGGIILFARRPVSANYASNPLQSHSQGNIRVIPMGQEHSRYRNKEIRRIEWSDGLPVKIEITRDYAIA